MIDLDDFILIQSAQPRIGFDLPIQNLITHEMAVKIAEAFNNSWWLRANITSLRLAYKFYDNISNGYYADFHNEKSITPWKAAELDALLIHLTDDDGGES